MTKPKREPGETNATDTRRFDPAHRRGGEAARGCSARRTRETHRIRQRRNMTARTAWSISGARAQPRRRLLRERYGRPRRRTANKRDKLPPPHRIYREAWYFMNCAVVRQSVAPALSPCHRGPPRFNDGRAIARAASVSKTSATRTRLRIDALVAPEVAAADWSAAITYIDKEPIRAGSFTTNNRQ